MRERRAGLKQLSTTARRPKTTGSSERVHLALIERREYADPRPSNGLRLVFKKGEELLQRNQRGHLFVKWCLGKDNHIVCCRRQVSVFHLPFSTRIVDYLISSAPVLVASFERMCWKWEIRSFFIWFIKTDKTFTRPAFANRSYAGANLFSYACPNPDTILVVKSNIKTTILLNTINSRNWTEQLAAWVTIMTTPTWRRGTTIQCCDRRALRMRSPSPQ